MTTEEVKQKARDLAREDGYHDREGKLTREDFRNFAKPKAGEKEETDITPGGEPPIPQIADILAAPRPPKIGESKLVSIAVTEDVPLKDVLIELSRLADVDMEIDPRISGGVIFSAREKPFNQVIERLSNLADLRYSMKNGVLRVEKDEPYIENYSVDFMNVERNSESNINISTNVLSSNGGGSSSGGSSSGGSSGGSSSGGSSALNSGSNASVTSKAESDLWKQFLEGVNQILRHKSTAYIAQPGGAETAAAGPVPASATGGASDAAGPQGDGKSFYVINKQAGIITISATERQHDQIKDFLSKLKRNASAQVLIEAKIVEVTLSDRYQMGVDWQSLQDGHGIDFQFPRETLNPVNGADISPFTLRVGSGVFNDLTAAVQLLQNFGTARTLSSPRLHAINNQQAVLTVAENKVFFEIQIEREQQSTTTTGATTSNFYTFDSNIKTVPIGLILTILPSINLDTSEVTLNIRPTLSRLASEVDDPSIAFLISQSTAEQATALSNIKNKIPVVEVRELDSVLKLKSGQVMVIGGLMQQTNNNTVEGIPGVSEIPVVGNLFKRTDNDRQTKELVIFIRATIVNSSGSADNTDKNIYKKYMDDPRPLTF